MVWGLRQKKSPVRIRHFDTLIGVGTELVGEVRFGGGLHLDGRIRGGVEGGDKSVLRISDQGVIDGAVTVPMLIINGTVNGDVRCCERLELAAKAVINGDVYYSVLEMTAGAQVNGNLIRLNGEDGASSVPEVPNS